MQAAFADDFASWRAQARLLLQASVNPALVIWNGAAPQASLFPEKTLPEATNQAFTVPPAFLAVAEIVSCHRSAERFSLLYHMLWRLNHESKHLLSISSDPLTHALQQMVKAVRRDVHKTKAFVRFRKTETEGEEHYIAWHRPDHYSLKLSAPFFARRFSVMRWTILTPDASAYWDLEQLHFGPGAARQDAPEGDAMEDLWREFYRAIFNPARVSVRAMKREMPVRHWQTLPEAQIINELLDEAPARVRDMIAHQEGMAFSAVDFLPESLTIENLRKAGKSCEGCPLYKPATQTVMGEGPQDAPLMLVGEQPGDEEDRQGRPFVGPAGQVLDRALAEAGLQREALYVTNAVKHFKFSYVGERRHHRTPTLKEITGCKPWLEAELQLVQPKIVVCLGASAARSLISPGFTLKEGRGTPVVRGPVTLLTTYHPSAVLRAGDGEPIYRAMAEDLLKAKQLLAA